MKKLRTAGRRRHVRLLGSALVLSLGISTLAGCLAVGGSELELVTEPGSIYYEYTPGVSQTLVIPDGYDLAIVEVIAGGGGGGGSVISDPASTGGRGGFGGRAVSLYSVVPGDRIDLTVGYGGPGGDPTGTGCYGVGGQAGTYSAARYVTHDGFSMWSIDAGPGYGGYGVTSCMSGAYGADGYATGGNQFTGIVGAESPYGRGGSGGTALDSKGAPGGPGLVRIILSPSGSGDAGGGGA